MIINSQKLHANEGHQATRKGTSPLPSRRIKSAKTPLAAARGSGVTVLDCVRRWGAGGRFPQALQAARQWWRYRGARAAQRVGYVVGGDQVAFHLAQREVDLACAAQLASAAEVREKSEMA